MERHKKLKTDLERFGFEPFWVGVLYIMVTRRSSAVCKNDTWVERMLRTSRYYTKMPACYHSDPSKNLKEVEYPKFGCAVCFHSQGKLF